MLQTIIGVVIGNFIYFLSMGFIRDRVEDKIERFYSDNEDYF